MNLENGKATYETAKNFLKDSCLFNDFYENNNLFFAVSPYGTVRIHQCCSYSASGIYVQFRNKKEVPLTETGRNEVLHFLARGIIKTFFVFSTKDFKTGEPASIRLTVPDRNIAVLRTHRSDHKISDLDEALLQYENKKYEHLFEQMEKSIFLAINGISHEIARKAVIRRHSIACQNRLEVNIGANKIFVMETNDGYLSYWCNNLEIVHKIISSEEDVRAMLSDMKDKVIEYAECELIKNKENTQHIHHQ